LDVTKDNAHRSDARGTSATTVESKLFMAGVSGVSDEIDDLLDSPRPASLGDVLGTVPLDPHGHRKGQRSSCIFFCC
jgi:hypothetical protein